MLFKISDLKFEISDALHIFIEDDGKGFDNNENVKGNGLKNYKKRIEDLHGSYKITSDIGIGTKIEFIVPFSA